MTAAKILELLRQAHARALANEVTLQDALFLLGLCYSVVERVAIAELEQKQLMVNMQMPWVEARLNGESEAP